MEDPFSALLKSLEPVFHFEAIRNGQYSLSPIQSLKDATKEYNPKLANTYHDLLLALRESLPYLEKWQVDFNAIITNMDELAKKHNLPTSDWKKILKHPKVSLKFQFSALNHASEVELIPWINSNHAKLFSQMNHFEVTEVLINLSHQQGFSQKLSAHLKKNPDFLVQLIMNSERNCIKILQSRLSLYLTDNQIANAIIHHLPKLVDAHANPFVQVEQLVEKINDFLSNGRSVTTLLRNGESKSILDNSVFFQIYQTEEYQNRHDEQQGPSLGIS